MAIYIKSCVVFYSCERAGLCAFGMFVCFVRVGFCHFPLPYGVRDWLRLVIVAVPGIFFSHFFTHEYCNALTALHAFTHYNPTSTFKEI